MRCLKGALRAFRGSSAAKSQEETVRGTRTHIAGIHGVTKMTADAYVEDFDLAKSYTAHQGQEQSGIKSYASA